MAGRRAVVLAVAASLLFLPSAGCRKAEEPVSMDLNKVEPPGAGTPVPSPPGAELQVALGGIITPREGLAYYHKLLGYLEGKLGLSMRYVDKEDYAEINRMLEAGSLDVAFVCSGPYVDAQEKFGVDLLAAPRVNGKPVYYCYVIVPAKSAAAALDDLRGKAFAFTDPLSNTGYLVPAYMLAKQGARPETFFGGTSFTHGHDKSIQAVADGIVDGAAVDSLIWDYYHRTRYELTSRTRILTRSEPFGIPPVVARLSLDAGLRRRIKESLLGAHEDPAAQPILAAMNIERFVEIDDKAYDSIREMKGWLARRAPSGGGQAGK